MKARVNDKCSGTGLCADICPEVFELGPDGKARVRVDTVLEGAEDSCREARQECPFQAIEVEE
ncbi:MAG TPA: ferredoxin [Phycisphaerae bacterium]|nr:ferredoxin [Phycisphaerae bacterium]